MLDGIRALIAQICRSTDAELRWLLPKLPSDVTLMCSFGEQVIPEFGYGASALDKHTITFVIAPSTADEVEQIIKEHLRHVLFHEGHHLVRGWVRRGGMRRGSFIDGVICEGLASTFERDAAGHTAPWCDYPEAVRAWVDELLALPVDADYQRWMFRHPDGRRWIGYKAGTYIVDRAFERTGLDAARLVSTPSRQILELAGLPPPRHIADNF